MLQPVTSRAQTGLLQQQKTYSETKVNSDIWPSPFDCLLRSIIESNLPWHWRPTLIKKFFDILLCGRTVNVSVFEFYDLLT